MEKKIFLKWLTVLVILFSANTQGQTTIGAMKKPEAFSVLELANIGGLRLPQMTTIQRNAFAISGNVLGEGLTIYNIDTKCVEYWNKKRWVSMCEGTSQTTISPQPCINVPADATGCDDTFTVSDVDCPNGPFTISIVAGGDYASLDDVDSVNGKFKVVFRVNETVNIHTVLVRVTSTCTSLYKEFLFSQNGVDCSSMSYSVPVISPATASLTLCTGGAVYLSVPADTPDVNKLIWTRNGIEVARGVNYYIATQKGKYNISMGAVGCNTNVANERTITESGTVAPTNISILASNNGVMCGTNAVILTAYGSTGTIAWFHNGVEEKTGTTVSISGDNNLGEWFAAVKDANCYSKQSNILTITKSSATGQVSVTDADVLVNGVPLSAFTAFCAGGSLNLSVANKSDDITYTWYNGNDIITTNPFIVPSGQATMSLRMVATDNSGATCPAEKNVIDKNIVSGSTPAQPTIIGNAVLCDGTTDLTLSPATAGTYTYTWYKDGVKMTETTATITVTTPGVTYTGSVTNTTGCTSTLATKAISPNVSTLPVLSWTSTTTSANFGANITLQTTLTAGSASSYTWTANNGATVNGSGASATIILPASGTAGTVVKVTVTTQNSCGKSATIEQNITMNDACPTPSLTAQSDLSQNTVEGKGITVKVSVTNGILPTYQWYSNTTATTTGGTAVSGATTASYFYTPSVYGTYYLYCIVKNGCTGNPTAVSPVFTVNAASDPGKIPTGSGTLGGKTCFDIAESNNYPVCGLLTSRQATKSDFNLVATNTQVYTFTPVGTVSKLRFVAVESVSGTIVQSFTPAIDKSQVLNITGAQKATLVYKTSLSSNGGVQGAAYGLDGTTALKVDIYAIYNNAANGSGTDQKVKITAQIKDCMCCGAMISPTVWKNFMCHNLGANQALDPFTPAPGIVGDYYNQGLKVPVVAQPDNSGWFGSPAGTKTAKDPCPAGYRVPTKNEFSGILSNNAQTYFGTPVKTGTYGVKIGNYLMLPAAEIQNDLVGHRLFGYWAQEPQYTIYSPTSTYIQVGGPSTTGTPFRMQVRCIEE